MWLKAESGLEAQKIVLSSDVDLGEAGDDRLTQLRTQADDRRTRKVKTAKKSRRPARRPTAAAASRCAS